MSQQRQNSETHTRPRNPPSTRRRSRYCPQRRLEVAKVRKAGACQDCRRRKVGCCHALQIQIRGTNIVDSPISVAEEEALPLSQVDLDILPILPPLFADQGKERLVHFGSDGGTSSPIASDLSNGSHSQPSSMEALSEGWRVDLSNLSVETFAITSRVPLMPYADFRNGTVEVDSNPSTLLANASIASALPWKASTTHQDVGSSGIERNRQFSCAVVEMQPAADMTFFTEDLLPYGDINTTSNSHSHSMDEGSTYFDAFDSFTMQKHNNVSPSVQPHSLSYETLENVGDANQSISITDSW